VCILHGAGGRAKAKHRTSQRRRRHSPKHQRERAQSLSIRACIASRLLLVINIKGFLFSRGLQLQREIVVMAVWTLQNSAGERNALCMYTSERERERASEGGFSSLSLSLEGDEAGRVSEKMTTALQRGINTPAYTVHSLLVCEQRASWLAGWMHAIHVASSYLSLLAGLMPAAPTPP
jgi:hypothetical protein